MLIKHLMNEWKLYKKEDKEQMCGQRPLIFLILKPCIRYSKTLK